MVDTENWCCTEYSSRNFTYRWKIKNFEGMKNCSQAHYIESPPFSVEDDDRKWCLRVYPRGVTLDKENADMRVYLFRISGKEVSVDFDISIIGPTNTPPPLINYEEICPGLPDRPFVSKDLSTQIKLADNYCYCIRRRLHENGMYYGWYPYLVNKCLQIVCHITLYAVLDNTSGERKLNNVPNDLSLTLHSDVSLRANKQELCVKIDRAVETFNLILAELRKANDLAIIGMDEAKLQKGDDLVIASNTDTQMTMETLSLSLDATNTNMANVAEKFDLMLAELSKANDMTAATNLNTDQTAETVSLHLDATNTNMAKVVEKFDMAKVADKFDLMLAELCKANNMTAATNEKTVETVCLSLDATNTNMAKVVEKFDMAKIVDEFDLMLAELRRANDMTAATNLNTEKTAEKLSLSLDVTNINVEILAELRKTNDLTVASNINVEKAAEKFDLLLAELPKVNNLTLGQNLAELQRSNDFAIASNVNMEKAIANQILAELRKANDLVIATNMWAAEKFDLILAELRKLNDVNQGKK